MALIPNAKFSLEDFLEACRSQTTGKKDSVYLQSGVKERALRDFGIVGERKIIGRLSSMNVEDFTHDNTAELKEDPKIIADSYTFPYGRTVGYVSYYQFANGNWLIKSFHKSLTASLTYNPFEKLLEFGKRITEGE